jgi:N-acetylneuraminic acid mutarotase
VVAATDVGLIVCGGTNWDGGTKVYLDGWSLQPARVGQAGHRIGTHPTPIAYAAYAAIYGQRIFVAGGSDGASTLAAAATVSIRRDGVTVRALPDLPAAVQMAGGACVDGRFQYVVGGTADPSSAAALAAEVRRLDLSEPAGRWATVAPLPGGGRMLAAVASAAGRVFVFGGMVAAPDGRLMADSDTAYRYEPEQDRWLKIRPLPTPRRGSAAVAIDERRLLIVGGCRNDDRGLPRFLPDAMVYDVVSDTYHSCHPLPYSATGMAVAVMPDGGIYVCGGEDRPRARTDRAVIGRVVRAEEVGHE